jgi:hypothetical protein
LKKKIVLDSYALLAYLTKEAGYETVKNHLLEPNTPFLLRTVLPPPPRDGKAPF